jgi:hypothetical protein
MDASEATLSKPLLWNTSVDKYLGCGFLKALKQENQLVDNVSLRFIFYLQAYIITYQVFVSATT